MQSIIRSSNNRVKEMRATSEKARSKRFAVKMGWAIFIVILMAVFVLTNLAMLQSFKEQPVYGFQRDERHALGVGPLLADMLKRRGFHKKPQQPSKKAAGPAVANASMALASVANDSSLSPVTDADKAQPSAADAESLKDDPLAMADEKLEESLKEGSAASDATADGLDADVLAAAGGDADLVLAAEAEAEASDEDAELEAANAQGSVKASVKAAEASQKGRSAASSTTVQASQRRMQAQSTDKTRQPSKGNVTGSASAQPKLSNSTRRTG